MECGSKQRCVYVIDDDREVRVSLSFQLTTLGYQPIPFSEASDFLNGLAELTPGPVLLDVRMPRFDGLQMLGEMKRQRAAWPIIMMTGHADVPVAVAAMKLGAIDFLEKPFEEELLIAGIERAFGLLDDQAARIGQKRAVMTKLGHLSRREREVLDQIAAGAHNKQIAYSLGLSIRTIEMHRANLFAKLGVRTAAEAVAYVGHVS